MWNRVLLHRWDCACGMYIVSCQHYNNHDHCIQFGFVCMCGRPVFKRFNVYNLCGRYV